MPRFPGPDADLPDPEKFCKVSAAAFSRELKARQGYQSYTQDDIRDDWPTLVTAIVLSGLCLTCLTLGIAKFSAALTMTTQSILIDVPESIKREALNYIR